MASPFDIDWSCYSTAYGKADSVTAFGAEESVGDWLAQLFSDDLDIAMQAAHKLWCGLCHQHAYVSSASVPAFPFLMGALERSPEVLRVEVLDILCGFAFCTRSDHEAVPEWADQLRNKLNDQRPVFERGTQSSNEEIASFSADILEALAA